MIKDDKSDSIGFGMTDDKCTKTTTMMSSLLKEKSNKNSKKDTTSNNDNNDTIRKSRRRRRNDFDTATTTRSTTTEQLLLRSNNTMKTTKNCNNDNTSSSLVTTKFNSFESWISSIAIFGDSFIALIVSFVLFVLSVGISLYLHKYNNDNHISSTSLSSSYNHPHYEHQRHKPTTVMDSQLLVSSLGPIPQIDPPNIYAIPSNHYNNNNEQSNDANNNVDKKPPQQLPVFELSDEMRTAFEKDGVVAIRGLLSTDLLHRLDIESDKLIQQQRNSNKNKQKQKNTQFFTTRHSVLYYPPPPSHYDDDDDSTTRSNHVNSTNHQRKLSAFAEVALRSSIPSIIASLLFNGTTKQCEQHPKQQPTVRVLRDIFLAKDNDEYVCGWHVDDMGFWPAMPESPGINAWIALDDIPTTSGGGFALAVQSHTASWRYDAYHATGASTTYPPNGYANVSHMVHHRTGNGTCNLHHTAPHIHQRMEDTKRIYSIQRGDVIFHTRWLFHRTVPLNRSNAKDDNDDIVYRRYSVRYGPGSLSIIPPGYGTELSVLWDETNGGRTADEVSERDGMWYPLAWPNNLKEISDETTTVEGEDEEELILIHGFDDLIYNKIPIAEKIAIQRRKEMKLYLKHMAKQQQHRPQNSK